MVVVVEEVTLLRLAAVPAAVPVAVPVAVPAVLRAEAALLP